MQDKTTTPLHTPRMRRLSAGRWLVESRSRPGIGYPCTVDACSCPAGKHGRLCWHRKLVRRVEAWYAAYDAGAPSAPVAPAPAPVPHAPVAPVRPAQTGLRALQAAFE